MKPLERTFIIDRKRVVAEVRYREMKVADILKALNLTKSGYYKKLAGGSEFTETEIAVLVKIFGMSIFLPFDGFNLITNERKHHGK